jgi:hypothetical protein
MRSFKASLKILLAASAVLSFSCQHNHESPSDQALQPALEQDSNGKTQMLFDHTNQISKDGEVFKKLLGRGFIGSERKVNHPGQQRCEFILFRPVPEQLTYLEFCHHDPSLPKDQVEFGKDPRDHWPGFSLKASQNLEAFFQSRKNDFADFKPNFEHKNYNWAEDNTSRLPGWNFLKFDHDPVNGIVIWVTEYEKRPNPISQEPIIHPNHVKGIVGMIWKNVSPKQRKDLQLITMGRAEGDRLILADGTWIHFVDESSALSKTLGEKNSPYLAVVLAVDSMSEFKRVAKPDLITQFQGQDAAIIKLGAGWDIIAIEKASH